MLENLFKDKVRNNGEKWSQKKNHSTLTGPELNFPPKLHFNCADFFDGWLRRRHEVNPLLSYLLTHPVAQDLLAVGVCLRQL